MEIFVALIDQLVKLASALAWPATLLIVLYYLRDPAGKMLEAIAERIKDPASDVEIGKEGFAIKSRLEALEIDQEQTKSLTLQALGVGDESSSDVSASDIEVDPELVQLANDYLQIEDPSWSQRVRLKDAAARKMADVVITKNVSRALLARQHNEGLILALAAASHTLPKSGDLEHLLHVADEVERLHIKYRIVMAIGRLFERGLADADQADEACAVLAAYKHGADKSLRGRIKYTETAIQAVGRGDA